MAKQNILSVTIAMILGSSIILNNNVCADEEKGKHAGRFKFEPIDSSASSADWNPAAPWKLPRGFEQKVVSNETSLNIYDVGRDDWHDMNTVNETGKMAGRYMYRTHEVRGQAEGGAVSVVDLETGETKLVVQDPSWDALDGIRWTPWGTILFAEEIDGGKLLEIVLDENNMMTATDVFDRPAVGRMAHEGIDVDADGNVYVVDEHRGQTSGCDIGTPCGGGIYKFVPNSYGDLSAGDLYALKVTGPDGVGKGEWVGPIDPATARQSGSEAGGTSFQRPEDVEIIGDTLYVAITEGPRAQGVGSEVYEGRVIAINLTTMMVTNFVKPGVNVPVEMGRPGDLGFQTGWDSIDNLAESPDGRLVIIEDNVPSDIWFASTRTDEFGASIEVELFGSLMDPSAEGTGIYFSPHDPYTLYVNVQHSAADDGDATWAISKTGKHDDQYADK
ncbi:alkaline phosphatase PhoX [Kaarinaea lacus]